MAPKLFLSDTRPNRMGTTTATIIVSVVLLLLISYAPRTLLGAPSWNRADIVVAAPGPIPTKAMFDFMRRFGYLEKGPNQAEALYSEDAVVEAIRNIQHFGALPETGQLDRRTIQLMSSPRCGVVDLVQRREHSSRHRRYVIGSESWRKRKITYFIANWSSKVGEDSVARFMQRAFGEWAKYSNLRFVRVYDPSADIIVGFGSGHHGDNYPFDGPGNILAHAFYPYEMNSYGGDIHFDEDENWKENSTHLSDGVDFYSVAIHELGHSLGLAHSPVYSSLMFPYYKGITQGSLDYDDILAMYKLYIQNPYITEEPHLEEFNTTKPQASSDESVDEDYEEPTTRPPGEPASKLPDFVTEASTVASEADQVTTKLYDIPITFIGDYTTVDDHITRHHGIGVPTPAVPEFTQVADVCAGGFDAVGVLRGEVFIFKGAHLWRLTEKYRVKEGYPVKIWQVFRGFPRHVQRIDAVYERESDNSVVLFSGKQYWIFDGLNYLHPEARPITDFGLPDSVQKVDAAMVWSKNQKTYIFAGDQFWRYNDTAEQADDGYPMSMDRWYGIPANLDAATSVASGKTYFFKGNYYWLYNNERVRPERGYPRRASNIWLGCR
ncbi:matrix metalloproteinase-2-like [Malaya genurostris]|uniref:matrix metalloproteinase-2-like n=1 Tax=Malaya genurostris TaxID=325434 RepID=UPI0026F39350|nr:matrix metalloproteinase-2-like [Malaya genurostris]